MKKLSQILDLKKLKLVNKNIHKAHGLPNECYTNNEYLSVERKKIFENKWVVIGVGSSIPNIGDAKPFDLLGIPLIIFFLLSDTWYKIPFLSVTKNESLSVNARPHGISIPSIILTSSKELSSKSWMGG